VAIANPIITNVVETGGDNEATDTVTAKWTGVTFSNGIAGEFQNPFTVPVFGEDVPAYVDRTHQWNGATVDLPLPSYLLGGEYIMIGNDNRDNANLRLDITVSEDVLVYILIDNRLTDLSAGDPPESGLPFDQWTGMTWMATNDFAPVITGWNRTADFTIPDEVGVDESGDGTGAGVAINNWSSVYSSRKSAGTFSLYQPDNPSRNMYGVVIKRAPGSLTAPPEIVLNSPTNNSLFYNPSTGMSFHVTTVSPNSIAPTAIKLRLNAADVTGLTVGGTSDNRAITYNGLAPNTAYRAQIIAADQAGRSSTNEFSFDTFNAANAITIEAEDYNYGGGQTKMEPIAVNSYTDLAGTPGIDFFDQNISVASTTYRNGEFVGLGNAGDAARDSVTSAGGTDYVVNQVDAGEWLNYTRTLPAGA
jgi:hypothetical protein